MASTAGKKTSRIFVWLLLVLLIAGLAGFGTNGLGGALTKIGSVGDTDLDLQQYANNLQREIQFEQRRLQRPVTSEEVRLGGIDARVRGAMIAEAALSEEASEVGLSVGDDEIGRQLQQIPSFRGPNGSFNRDTYQLALRQSNTTASDFEAQLRSDAARTLLQQAVAGGLTANKTYADTLHGFIAEQRDFDWVLLDEALLDTSVPEPTETDLSSFHSDNPTMFETPQTRQVTYAWLTPDMLAGQVDIEEAAVRRLYDDRAQIYNLPERRLVERLSFPDMAAASDAKSRIEAGETSFEALVEERGLTLDDVDQGVVAPADLDGPISEAVFAVTEPGLSAPVDTSLGPALYRINAVLEAQVTPFEEARADLEAELSANNARQLIIDQTEPVDDQLVGGATLEELARDSDMELATVDYHAGVSDGLAAYQEFRTLVPTLTEDDFPEIVTLSDGGIFAARLDQITEPSLPALDDIREEVSQAWRADELRKLLEARAEDLIAELDTGKSMQDLDLAPTSETELARTDFIDGAPRGMITEAFEMEEGETRVFSDAGLTALVQIKAITPPDTSDEDAQTLLDRINEQASQTLAADVFQIYGTAVQARQEISINEVAIDQVIRQLTGEGHGG